jgi:GDP-4-dehydro-6-deoxy-D-mannose reductase
MTILVTGAAGAVGRSLVPLLDAREGDVVTTDVVHLARPGHLVADLAEPAEARALVERLRPDCILHLSGAFSGHLETDYRANVRTTQSLLSAASDLAPSCRIVLVGSAAEYGNVGPHDNPVRETHRLAPRSIYGLTKATQTSLMHLYGALFGLDVVMARAFNLTGAGLSERLLPGRLERAIARVRSGEIDRIVLGSLEARRDLMPVERFATELLRVADHGARDEVYHVASGVPTRIRDYVSATLEAAGLDLGVVEETGSGSPRSAEVMDIWADVEKLRGL